MARADVKVTTDLDSSKMKAGLTKMRSGISGMVKTATGKFLALGAVIGGLRGLGGLGKLAMEAEEVDSKFKAVFKESAPEMLTVIQDLKKHIHATTTEMKNSLATYKAMADGMGFTDEAGKILAESMVRLQGDLASFHNLNADEAFNKIKSAISGEFEPLKQLGIVLNEATIKQEALNLGIYDGTTALTASQKALAVQSAVVRMMGDANGDAEATTNSSMNAYKRLNAELKDLGENLGILLVPLVNKLVEVTSKAVDATENIKTSINNVTDEFADQAKENLVANGVLEKGLIGYRLSAKAIEEFGIEAAFTTKKTELIADEIARLTEEHKKLNEEVAKGEAAKDAEIRKKATEEQVEATEDIVDAMGDTFKEQQNQLKASGKQIGNAKKLLDLEEKRQRVMHEADTNKSGVVTRREEKEFERRQRAIESQRRRVRTAEMAIETMGGEEKAMEIEKNDMFGDPTLKNPGTRQGRKLKEFYDASNKLEQMELGDMARQQNLRPGNIQPNSNNLGQGQQMQPQNPLEDSKKGGSASESEENKIQEEIKELLEKIAEVNEESSESIGEIKDLMDKIDGALT